MLLHRRHEMSDTLALQQRVESGICETVADKSVRNLAENSNESLLSRHKNVILMVVNGGKMRTKGE
jgi:hypothetical protein